MKKRIILNMSTSLVLEIVSLVCAFILPRLILVNFGSEYNGIVTSVTQFLSVITLLRGGVGGVTRAALYKPLQEHDDYKISGILKATEKFMRKIAVIFAAFLVVFAFGYPLLINSNFEWFFTFSLIIILGLSTLSQYYFGITYQMLIQADQRQYVYSILQTIATILNTVFSVILINVGMEFRLVKLASALVFGAIPICLYFYVHKRYNLIKDVPSDNIALGQRWDAFAHQVSAFIHTNTDVVLLTIFSDLFQVSIFTVYSMVTNGVKKFVNICTNGIEAAIGNLIARNQKGILDKGIDMYEWIMHVISITLFVSTAILILPFIKIYTADVTDANYFQPLLGYLLCISQFLNCVRLPYQNVVEAAGHFKRTRNGAILEAIINILVSIPLVLMFGSTGAVAGTIVALAFRTIQYAVYASKFILKRSLLFFIKRCMVSGILISAIMIIYFALGVNSKFMQISSYFEWFVFAVVVVAIVFMVTIIVNMLVYFRISKNILDAAFSVIKKRTK